MNISIYTASIDMRTFSLDNINLYRITHIDNIPHILQYGVTHRHSSNANPNYVAIGDTSLIECRSNKVVAVGNNKASLGEYIPFYFGVRMPMLYVIQLGGNFVPSPVHPDDLVYVVVSLKELIKRDSNDCIFSDGHAMECLSSFYDMSEISRLPSIIDWESVLCGKWSGDGIPTDVKRKKQAEFLVGHDVPVECVVGFVCHSDVASMCLQSFGIPQEKIKVSPESYY